MKTKFAGKCRCGARVPEQTEVTWIRGEGIVKCPECSTGAAAPASRPAAPSAIAKVPAARPAVFAADLAGQPVPLLIIPPATVALDEFQTKVRDCTGVNLVAAGAGSGKTTTLIERIARLVSEGVLPESILLLVYNRKAADDMRAKLSDRLGSGVAERVGAFTFHGWAQRILQRWCPGDARYRTVLGADEDGPSPYPLANAALRDLGLNGEADGYLAASSFIREACIDLTNRETAVEEIARLRVAGGSLKLAEELLSFTVAYQEKKAASRAIDFADMLSLVADAIRRNTPHAQDLAHAYRHVLVDEAQDANVARNLIAWHVGAQAESLVVVGDLRQSIYGFTGARPDLFKGLLDRGATLLTMPVNRRSTAAIVAAGNAVADGRDWNLGGACSPRPDAGEGEPVRFFDGDPSVIAADIQARVAEGLPLADEHHRANYAILVRTNAGGAALEASLLARGLPVRVLGSRGGIWETTPGRHLRAYLAAAEDRAVEGLVAIANRPLRYIKGDVVKPLVRACAKGGLRAALHGSANRGAYRLVSDLDTLASMEWPKRVEAAVAYLILDLKERAAEAGDVAGRAIHPDEDKEKAYAALGEAAIQAGSLAAIDAQIAQAKRIGKDDPAVEIATCHKSKGAEWTVVYVAGVTDDAFPHPKAEDEEEERRLFYVAVTRAKLACIVAGDDSSPFYEALQAAVGPKGGGPDGGPEGGEKAPLLTEGEESSDVVDRGAHATSVAALDAAEGRIAEGLAARVSAVHAAERAEQEAQGAEYPHEIPFVGKLERQAVEAWRTGSDAATTVPTAADATAVLFGAEAWAKAVALAERETEKEPHATEGEGGRYVEVVEQSFDTLLGAALGFTRASREVTMRMHQRVWERSFAAGEGLMHLRVYSTIPAGDAVAREVGEDSIKVAAIYEGPDGKERPLHKRLPYACRTRGWRNVLLTRIAEVAPRLVGPTCPKCGAPMATRKAMRASGPEEFLGCVTYPACNGTRKVE